jgi:hypothetical protein
MFVERRESVRRGKNERMLRVFVEGMFALMMT